MRRGLFFISKRSRAMKFKLKQLEVEAVLFTAGNIDEVLKFLSDYEVKITKTKDTLTCSIELSNTVMAKEGDYIVKDIEGLLLYSPEIFNKKYVSVEN